MVNDLNREVETPKQCHLEVQKVLNSLRTQYYSLEENMKKKNKKYGVEGF